MEFTDIHTHMPPAEGKPAIYNCGTEHIAGIKVSAGIHPWNVSDDWEEKFKIVEAIAQNDNCIAVGECGIDKLKGGCTEIQEEAFRAHAMLAEKIKKPLIIHCVKSIDAIIAMHKETAPEQAWIIHGFRGKPQQAMQLIKAGLYVSFGEHFNAESVKAVPLERILIESDESRLPIEEIYSLAAEAKGITAEELACIVRDNAKKCNMLL
ncbi:MAG: TatD family hydrolase [Bacteroidaceae bacterium]|nr:TatD family hydrolase [Bacteroidaceae bacterium]